jgi:hypothetical protein
MPTYASTANFDLSIDDIAEEAFERCGLQVRSGYDLKTARRSLNLLLAEWANRGLNLWTIQLQEKSLPADTTSLTGIPFRFLPCMTAGLAYYIAMKKAPDRIQLLKQIYEDEFQRAAAQDGERTSLFLTPKTYLPSV